MAIEHDAIPDAGLHEIKGAAAATLGQVPISDGAGSHVWTTQSTGTVIGWADYNDTATTGTPITVTGGAGYVYLTNDGLGSSTSTGYLPTGVGTDLWDAAANKFDWSDLVLGDMVDIRLDIDVITTGANQEFDVVLELATDGTAYNIQFDRQLIKAAGTVMVNQYNGVYMGDANTLNNRARFKIQSDANATVVVNGWYCKVLINR